MSTLENKRFMKLRGWMAERNITLRDVGERVGLATGSVHYWLNNDYIDQEKHAILLELGFPAELLPIPQKKTGRILRKPPYFPGEQNKGPGMVQQDGARRK